MGIRTSERLNKYPFFISNPLTFAYAFFLVGCCSDHKLIFVVFNSIQFEV